MRFKNLVLIILGILLISTFAGGSISHRTGPSDPVSVMGIDPIIDDPLITIDGDDELEQKALDLGWEGTGTASDPIIASGLSFDGEGGLQCVQIMNTELHLVIKNSTFQNATNFGNIYYGGYGLRMAYTSNISVINCTFLNNNRGLMIQYSDNITSSGCNYLNNAYQGICLYYVDDASFRTSRITDSIQNIYSYGSKSAEFVDLISKGSEIPLEIWTSTDQLFERCVLEGTDDIKVYYLDNLSIKSCSMEGVSIFTYDSEYLTFSRNTIRNGSIQLDDSEHTRLWNNMFYNGGVFIKQEFLGFEEIEIPANNSVNGRPILYTYNIDYDNSTMTGGWGQYILGNVSNLILKDIFLQDVTFPMIISRSNNLKIRNVNMSNSVVGILIDRCHDLIISGNTLIDMSDMGVIIQRSHASILSENVVDGADIGFYINYNSYGIDIINNRISNSSDNGIMIYSGVNDCLVDNNELKNNEVGIYFLEYGQTGNKICNNRIFNSRTTGAIIESVYSQNYFVNNVIRGSGEIGIELVRSNGLDVGNNQISDSGYYSILINDSGDCDIYGNQMTGSGIMLFRPGSIISNHMPSNNTIDSMPIYYYKGNGEGKNVPDSAGQIVIDGCHDLKVEGIDFSNVSFPIVASQATNLVIKDCEFNSVGRGAIHLYRPMTATIENNNFTGGEGGINVYNPYSSYSSNVNVNGNHFFSISGSVVRTYRLKGFWAEGNKMVDCGNGFIIKQCNNCTFKENLLNDVSGAGIFLEKTHFSRIIENTFHSCSIGVKERIDSNNNAYSFNLFKDCAGPAMVLEENCFKDRIYNNAFVNNNGTTDTVTPGKPQVRDLYGQGKWFHTDGVGNYWHDLRSPDLNDDGKVDIPYEIPNSRSDDYPLTEMPFSLVSPPTSPFAIGGKGHIMVGWDIPEDTRGMDIIQYSVYRYNGTFEEESIFDIPGDRLFYNDTGVNSDETYTYHIQSETELGISEMTGPLSATSDGTSPVMDILNPLNGSIINRTSINMVWDVEDPNSGSGVSSIIMTLDGEDIFDLTGFGSFLIMNLSNGRHDIFVIVTDNVGNYFSTRSYFTVDLDAPDIDITSPLNGTLFNRDQIAINWKGTDLTSGIRDYSLRLDGGIWIPVENNISHSFDHLSEGGHRVDVIARDLGGNFNITSAWFTIDTVAPLLTVRKLQNDSYHKIGRVIINWSAKDDLTGLDKVSLFVDGSLDTDDLIMEEFYINDLADGTHTIKVVAVDRAGNERSLTYTVHIDTIFPQIIEHYPQGEGIPSTAEIFISFNEKMNWDVTYLTFLGIPVTYEIFENNITYLPPSSLDLGLEYDVEVTGTDIAGNPVSFGWNFTTDTTGSIMGQIVSEDNSFIDGAIIMVNGEEVAITDVRGFYHFDIPMGSYKVDISAEGYGEKTFYVDVSAGSTTDAGQTKLTRVDEHDIDDERGSIGTFLPVLIGLIIVLLVIILIVIIIVRRSRGSIQDEPGIYERVELLRDEAQREGRDISYMDGDYRNALYQRDIGDLEDSEHSMELYSRSLEEIIEAGEE